MAAGCLKCLEFMTLSIPRWGVDDDFSKKKKKQQILQDL